MTEKRLHPSLASHLDTDLQVLSAVIERSKFQHRSQPFLRRMREVLRLGRRVAVLVNEYSTASAIDASTDDQSNAVEREIVVKFIQCLMKATVSIQQIIELEHFLPTQISVIAVYGRLFALGISIANVLDMEMEETLGVPKRTVKTKRKREDQDQIVEVFDNYIETAPPVASRRVSTFDLGQKIARPVRSPSPTPSPPAPAPIRSPSKSESATPPPSSPDILPSPVRLPTPPIEKPKKKKKMNPEIGLKKKVKGKKKDDMDDIFGF